MSLLSRITQRLKRGLPSGHRLQDPSDQIADVLDDILNHGQHYAPGAIVLAIELDGFDTLRKRHAADDLATLITIIEHRLKGGILSRDVVRRIGAGQFACVLSPLHGYSEEDVLILAGQIQNLIAVPVAVNGLAATVTASIGCVVGSDTLLNNGHAMLEAAQIAQMEASAKGTGGLRFYDAAMGEKMRTRRALAIEAQEALSSGAVTGYFQPQISLKTGEVTGFEALARWHHDTRGLLPPGAFLPVMEQAGLMRILGHVILNSALRTLKAWDGAGLKVPRIAVNMCAEQLRHTHIATEVSEALEAHGLTPDRLVIEVLETVSVGNPEDPIIQNLNALSSLGCQIDLDDFGTGHASIKSVHAFAIDRIKIDRSYVAKVDSDPEQQQVVRTILSMAQNLHVDTLAEGVETAQELSHLTQSGCGHAQGYVISHPLAAADATAWMRARPHGAGERPISQVLH